MQKLQHMSTKTYLSYAITCKHGNLPKLQVQTLLSTKPQTVVSQSTTRNFTIQAVGWFLVIEYRFVDYKLQVLGHQIPVC